MSRLKPSINAIAPVPFQDYESLTDLLWRSFGDDPYVRYLLGDQDAFIREILALRLRIQAQTRQPILGLWQETKIIGAALYAEPDQEVSVWVFLLAMLELVGRGRGDLIGKIIDSFRRIEVVRKQIPHQYYLTLLVIDPDYQKQGYGTQLLQAIHQLSERDPRSRGVWLETDVTDNLPWYERFGYQRLGEIPVGPLRMVALFRANPTKSRTPKN